MLKKLKLPIKKLLTNSKFGEWFKLISLTGFTQIIVQALGFVSGIILIRVLSIEQYAIYTIANTMLGTMVVLSDAGISSGVMAEGGKVWEDKRKLGKILATGFDLRKKMAFISMLVTIPILLYMLRNINASWLISITVALALIPAFISVLSSSLLYVPAKLRQDVIKLQYNSLEINFSRMILLSALIFIFPWAFIAILVSGISQIWGNFRIRKVIKPYVEFGQNPSLEVKKRIIKILYRTLPESIYYCISGQITIWILAVFGSTNAVAEIGALSRIAVLLAVLTVLFHTLIIPRFARLKNDYKLIFKRFLSIQIVLAVILMFVLLGVYLFSYQILWVLGPKYYSFESELFLVTIGSCLNIFSGLTFSICVSRGWVINPLLSIPSSVITMICCLFILDVSTLYGVLIFNIILASAHTIINSSFGFVKIFGLRRNFSLR